MRAAARGAFFGRAAELAEIDRLLGATSIVTLVGAAGCGKTRLASEAVDALSPDRFPDGVAWAGLAPLPEGAGIADVLAALCAAVGLTPRPGTPLLDQLGARLSAGRLLVVLDNCEHVIAAVADVLDGLATAASDVRVIVTSQEAVRVDGEGIVSVGALPLPVAVQLFTARVETAAPGVDLTGDNAAAVEEVCRRLDGVPLALELAAAAAPSLGVVDLAANLDERFALLVSGRRTDMLRHQTLEAAIRWSLDRLPAPLASTLGALSVFAGGFTLEAAAAVADARASDVAALVAKSLVARDASGRYRILESIRLLASDALAQGERDDVAGAHLVWCRALAAAANADLAGPNEPAALARLEAELGNLRGGLVWSLAQRHDPVAGAELALALGRFWYLRGHYEEAARWLHDAMDVAPDLHGPLAAALGVVCQATGRLAEASAHFTASLAAGRARADDGVVARSLQGLAHVAAVQGDHPAAWDALTGALVAARTAGKVETIVGILHSQASVAIMRADYGVVRERAEEGLGLAVAAGDGRGEALALLQLAGADLVAGRNPDAARHLMRSLELGRELDIPLVLSTALGTLGNLAFNTGDFIDAANRYGESLAVARAMGDQRLEMITLQNMAEVARISGELSDARRLFGEASAIARRLGDRRAMAIIHEGLSDIARDLGDLDGAAALLAQSLTARRDVGDRRGVASALDSVARLVDYRGDTDEAVRLVAAATAMYEAIAAARGGDAAAWAEGVVARTAPDRVAALLADGRAWTVEAAVERALALVDAHALELPAVAVAAGAATGATAPVAIDVLGGFVVRRHGKVVPAGAWQSKKARELLKLLIVRRGQPVPREQLVEWLWPGDEPSASANRLRVALSVLRSVLDPGKANPTGHYVRSEAGSLRLDLDHVEVDVEQFMAAVAATDHATAEVRYRGEVLPEDVYEDWAVPLREEARVAYISVATALLRKAVASGDAATAARLSVRLLERDPYDESSHVALITALSSLGRHGDAQRAHDIYAGRMQEIGIDVTPLATIGGS